MKRNHLPDLPLANDRRLQALREHFPEAFAEGKIDFDKLRAALGDTVDGHPERYSFTWAGKHDAIRLLQAPTRATLTPAPEESVDWETTRNIFIEGENLEALKLICKSYFGRVKMIYIDPPYNTGNDFIYPDNFADPLETYLKLSGQSLYVCLADRPKIEDLEGLVLSQDDIFICWEQPWTMKTRRT